MVDCFDLENSFKNLLYLTCVIYAPRFIHIKTAAMGPPPIERTLKTDLESVLMVYNQYYNTTSTFDCARYSLILKKKIAA